MNKRLVERWLPSAQKALKDTGVASKTGVIEKTFRGQISTFGAAVSMGSLLTAIAFFSENANTQDGKEHVERSRLMPAILAVLKDNQQGIEEQSLYDYALRRIRAGEESRCREEILLAAIALKLAMNLFELKS